MYCLNPTMVMRWHALWCVWIIDCYYFPVSLCEAEVYVYEIPDLTIFKSSISYIWFACQSLWEDWGVLNDFFLMMSCCDMFDLTILESSISIILGYFSVAHWEPMDIVIYFGLLFGCSLRTVGYCDLSLMPSVADRELLWSWLSFDAFQLLMENWCDYCGLSFDFFQSLV